MNPVELVEKKYMEREAPEFRPGDTVRVNAKIREGGKFRIQAFEGVVIAIKRRGLQSTFTVRKVTSGYFTGDRKYSAAQEGKSPPCKALLPQG
jgi:large subunit ribosomal protein L19